MEFYEEEVQPLSHEVSDSGDMEVFIDHSNTETWQEHLHRNFISAYFASLPSRESTGVSDSSHNQQIFPTSTRPTRFRPDHSTTSALLQMTTYIAMGCNQRKPPDRTICVAVDLSAEFDTVPICCRRTNHSSPRTQRDGCHVI